MKHKETEIFYYSPEDDMLLLKAIKECADDSGETRVVRHGNNTYKIVEISGRVKPKYQVREQWRR